MLQAAAASNNVNEEGVGAGGAGNQIIDNKIVLVYPSNIVAIYDAESIEIEQVIQSNYNIVVPKIIYHQEVRVKSFCLVNFKTIITLTL